MRFREPFTIFPRKLPSGVTVFYYQTYDQEGQRIFARSTGKTTKTAARIYCIDLMTKGRLVPEVVEKKIPTLGEFAFNFWAFGKSDFLKYKAQRGYVISQAHARNQGRYVTLYIEPTFGRKRIDQITAPMIETWFLSLKDLGKTHQTCNHLLSNLRTILGEAHRKGLIAANPADAIKPLAKQSKTRGILTTDEVRQLLGTTESVKLWPSYAVYLANLFAATTGMRMGEIQAIRWQDLSPLPFPDRITVRHSWDRRYGLKTTKTSKERIIPISPALRKRLLATHPRPVDENFVFSTNYGESPVHESVLLDSFYAALDVIGIPEAERKERNITFHGWRHFFNTFLRRAGVHDSKVQLVTGHSTSDMTEHYTHFDLNDLKEVTTAQGEIVDGAHMDRVPLLRTSSKDSESE